MSVRLEVAIRVAALDGTALAESAEVAISPYAGDDDLTPEEHMTRELQRANPILQSQIERVRTNVERQIAHMLDESDGNRTLRG